MLSEPCPHTLLIRVTAEEVTHRIEQTGGKVVVVSTMISALDGNARHEHPTECTMMQWCVFYRMVQGYGIR